MWREVEESHYGAGVSSRVGEYVWGGLKAAERVQLGPMVGWLEVPVAGEEEET